MQGPRGIGEKEIAFRLRYALGMRQRVTGPHSFLFLLHHESMETIC